MSIAAISILVGGGLPTFKNGLIMKKINAIILLSSLTSASVFAGAYVENREAYNLASDQGEVMLRVGYNFDMGAGIMLTNTYTFQREDELKHGYNEIEGWGNDSNLLIVFYVQIMPDDFVMQLHRF